MPDDLRGAILRDLRYKFVAKNSTIVQTGFFVSLKEKNSELAYRRPREYILLYHEGLNLLYSSFDKK